MKTSDTEKYEVVLKGMPTHKLEHLLSKVLREMRRRDSDHIKGDAISTSQAIRSLRASGKLT
jgi:hypothetical protein